MALPNLALIQALRVTALRLRQGNYYSWGNHGSCNCGNLLQVVSDLSADEILKYAHTVSGEWTEIANEYCSQTHVPVELLMEKLISLGLTATDIHHLEYLSDPAVLKQLPGGFRWLKRNQRSDVIEYFEAFALGLEQKLLFQIELPQFIYSPEQVSEPV